jgi:hypothetical protein
MYALMNNDNAATVGNRQKIAGNRKKDLVYCFRLTAIISAPTNRERAYELQFAPYWASAIRVRRGGRTWTTRAIDWYLNYFKRQMDKYPDGSFVKKLFYFPQDGYYAYHYHQPFIDAIAGESFVMVHKLSGRFRQQ